MTPTSPRPLNKVRNSAIATALAVLIMALVRNYVWKDMPADLAGPLNTFVLMGVPALASFATGYMTRIAPGEIKLIDRAIVEGEAGRHGTGA